MQVLQSKIHLVYCAALYSRCILFCFVTIIGRMIEKRQTIPKLRFQFQTISDEYVLIFAIDKQLY